MRPFIRAALWGSFVVVTHWDLLGLFSMVLVLFIEVPL